MDTAPFKKRGFLLPGPTPTRFFTTVTTADSRYLPEEFLQLLMVLRVRSNSLKPAWKERAGPRREYPRSHQ